MRTAMWNSNVSNARSGGQRIANFTIPALPPVKHAILKRNTPGDAREDPLGKEPAAEMSPVWHLECPKCGRLFDRETDIVTTTWCDECLAKYRDAQIIIRGRELSTDDLKKLLQAIRDCEQESFPDKKLHMFISLPYLTAAEGADILRSIRPPFTQVWEGK